MSDEIGNSTLIGCGFKVTKGGSAILELGLQTLFGPVPNEASTSSGPTIDTSVAGSDHFKGGDS